MKSLKFHLKCAWKVLSVLMMNVFLLPCIMMFFIVTGILKFIIRSNTFGHMISYMNSESFWGLIKIVKKFNNLVKKDKEMQQILKSGGNVIIANHVSNIDPYLQGHVTRYHQALFLSKPQTRKYPFIKYAIESSTIHLPHKGADFTIKDVIDDIDNRLAAGYNLTLYPQGHKYGPFNRSKLNLGLTWEFYSRGYPILVSIHDFGLYMGPLPTFSMTQGDMHLKVFKPIKKGLNYEQFRKEIYERIYEKLDEMLYKDLEDLKSRGYLNDGLHALDLAIKHFKLGNNKRAKMYAHFALLFYPAIDEAHFILSKLGKNKGRFSHHNLYLESKSFWDRMGKLYKSPELFSTSEH